MASSSAWESRKIPFGVSPLHDERKKETAEEMNV